MKTVKVRIAVAIDHEGDWEALGSSRNSDQESQDIVSDFLNHATTATAWVEAQIEIPETSTITGKVTE